VAGSFDIFYIEMIFQTIVTRKDDLLKSQIVFYKDCGVLQKMYPLKAI
jgi:hypothetical protein